MFQERNGFNPICITLKFVANKGLLGPVRLGCGLQLVALRLVLMFPHLHWFVHHY